MCTLCFPHCVLLTCPRAPQTSIIKGKLSKGYDSNKGIVTFLYQNTYIGLSTSIQKLLTNDTSCLRQLFPACSNSNNKAAQGECGNLLCS